MKNNNRNNNHNRNRSYGYENDYNRQGYGNNSRDYSGRGGYSPEDDSDRDYENYSAGRQGSGYNPDDNWSSDRNFSSGGSNYGRLSGRGMDYDVNQQGRGTHRSSYGSENEDYGRMSNYNSDYRNRGQNQDNWNNSGGMYGGEYGRRNRGGDWNSEDRGSYGNSNYGNRSDNWNSGAGGYGNSGNWNPGFREDNWNESNRASGSGNWGQHRGKGPKGYKRSDERIQEDINDRLSDHGELDATDIEVKVQNGEVTLSGTVKDKTSKRRAEDIADEVSGVSNVENKIKISKEDISSPGSTENKRASSNSSSDKKEKAHQLN